MELGKDKLKYVVNYGIAPFFAEGLKKQVSVLHKSGDKILNFFQKKNVFKMLQFFPQEDRYLS